MKCAFQWMDVRMLSFIVVTGYTELRGGKSIVLVKLYDDRKPWDDALKVCEADGGTLLKIDSKYIQVQIGKKFPLRGLGK